MYKVELLSDKLQQAALERRTRLEEERKARIFDPKARLIGIDVRSLEEHTKLKQQLKDLEKEREQAFNNQLQEAGALLTHLDVQSQINRRNHLKLLDEYRKNHQKPHERREYHLNDPNTLKKDRPPRESDDDPRLHHHSNLQQFHGEDLDKKSRSIEQQKQMKIWAAHTLHERRLQKEKEAKERAEFERQQDLFAAKARELQHAADQAKRDNAKRDLEINMALEADRRKRERENKEREEQANMAEIQFQVNGSVLTEQSDAASSNNGHKIRADIFKGFSEEQNRDIIAMQALQRKEQEIRNLKQRELEKQWDQKSILENQASLFLEQEENRLKRERAIKVRLENERLAKEEKERKTYFSKVVYTNQPQKGYFEQFSTTSR